MKYIIIVFIQGEDSMKKFMIGAVLMLMVLSGCQANTTDTDTIRIGMNMELSGPYVDYGTQEKNGVELAVKVINDNGGINGKKVELITYDNKSDAASAIELQTKLVTEDNVLAVVGPAVSSLDKAVAPVSAEYKIPVVFSSGTADGVVNNNNEAIAYAYRICFGDAFQGVTMANFATANLNAKKAVILKDTNDYGTGTAKSFKEQFEANGGVVLKEESFTTGDSDFNALLTNLKNAGSFDVIYVAGYYAEVGKIIAQARALDMNEIILGPDGFEAPELVEIAGASNLSNAYYTNHYSSLADDEALQEFIALYKETYQVDPGAFSALGYDAAMLIIEAIANTTDLTGENVNVTLEKTKGFEGITGVIDIDDLHEAIKSSYVIELQDGSAVNAVLINP